MDFKKIRVWGILAIIVFAAYLILPVASAVDGNNNVPVYLIALVTILIVSVFGGLMYAGYKADADLNKGEMRRAIAGTFSVGFIILMVLSLHYSFDENKEIVTTFIQLVGVVIGFYFGTRTALSVPKNMTGTTESGMSLDIENVKFETDELGNPTKKITFSIRNRGDTDLQLDKIYFNGEDFDRGIQIKSQSSVKETIEIEKEWIPNKEYNFKVATTTGIVAEKIYSSPTVD
ncbi:hypothetical protein Metev_1343 [Methanohalobium evestigatum Z-7303]|uniref:Uncharacterized protein n=1 Tax=Methanohalobium evestigatum (strain ATCC BAA-1072 / DSM 3721 / NBRC 107634 / OCM 161 / Z-7303) TaxID=644295 RepID=D7E9C9_METEZ|nr:hypothetical protein [Methanohalobium evestigatum]ADI74201.1 hypothetical protein Metev_1343 [Methanohalobium evestigatum Z-7303]